MIPDGATPHPNAMLTETYRVRAYEAGADGLATLQSICNYLQESAGNHARLLGVAIDDLMKQQQTWVLSRLQVRVSRYPAWREEMTLRTWPSTIERLYALRDFEVEDASGAIVVRAVSAWLMLKLPSGRPLPIPESIRAFHPIGKARALTDSFDKLPLPERVQAEHNFAVRLSDLDINQHVNNVNYIEWAVESVPDALWATHRIEHFEIGFHAAGVRGDTVRATCQMDETPEGPVCLHRLEREADGRELARARSRWVRHTP